MASDAQGIPLVRSDHTCGGAAGIPVHHVWSDLEVKRGAKPTHVAHALDAASVAARREAMAQAMSDLREHMSPTLMTFAVPTFQQYADAVLKALGLDGPT